MPLICADIWLRMSNVTVYLTASSANKPGLFLFIFVLFSTQWHYSTKFDYKNHRWCPWDLNPGRQDGRCKRIHWAKVSPQFLLFMLPTFVLTWPLNLYESLSHHSFFIIELSWSFQMADVSSVTRFRENVSILARI